MVQLVVTCRCSHVGYIPAQLGDGVDRDELRARLRCGICGRKGQAEVRAVYDPEAVAY